MPGLRSDRLSPVKGTGRWRGPEGAGCCFPFGNLTALSGARPELFSSLFLHRKRRNALADHDIVPTFSWTRLLRSRTVFFCSGEREQELREAGVFRVAREQKAKRLCFDAVCSELLVGSRTLMIDLACGFDEQPAQDILERRYSDRMRASLCPAEQLRSRG